MNEPEHISSFVPMAYQELLAMIEKGKREREDKGKKRARLDGPDGPQVTEQYDWPDDPDDDCYHLEENPF